MTITFGHAEVVTTWERLEGVNRCMIHFYATFKSDYIVAFFILIVNIEKRRVALNLSSF